MTARCLECGANLSRYRPPGTVYCAAHEPDRITHLDYIESGSRDPETCKRGHDLRIHGRLYNTGGGRMTRKCSACVKLRDQIRSLARSAA